MEQRSYTGPDLRSPNLVNRMQLPTALPVLPGVRLALRTMTDDDAAALFAIYGDPEVMRYTDEAPFPGVDTVSIMLASVRTLLATGESLEWAIILHASGEVIGTCGLHGFLDDERSAQVGCVLKHSHWGHGHMTEAVTLLMRFASNVLKLECVTADVDPENERSLRMFQRLGFRQSNSGELIADL